MPSQTNDLLDVCGAVLVCIAILGVFDVACSSTKARWFSIHAFGNLLAAALAMPSMMQWLTDPVTSMNDERFPTPPCLSIESIGHVNCLWPVVMIVAQHLYHFIAFKDVRSGDVWHHLAFVPVIGVWAGLIVPWGPLRNVLGFFISGLPGGIDYAALVLQKHGLLGKRAQRRLGVAMALLIRAPGLLLEGFTMYFAKIYGETTASWLTVCIVVLFSVGNALYYLQQTIGAYYVFCFKDDNAKLEVPERRDDNAKPEVAASEATVCGSGVAPHCVKHRPQRAFRRHLPS
eukprot:TRINITY_DN56128_c0_g1_i1.p1 TRINITY_DN56128_c0_g1~~TRINITY_DN56128_c0_g1_i1.p1  ORF type:complete len:316 (+),score=106.22 TRINITY_DN56128_c0_g1_i1:86-949(+)